MTQTVYVSIGNSDDKLPQAEYAEFVEELLKVTRNCADVIHGEWFSAPGSPFQNACVGIDVLDDDMDTLRGDLAGLCADFEQEAIAMALVKETVFL